MAVGDAMKFGDMPYGTHFQELRRGGRKFIKLQDVLPSGLHQKHQRVISSGPDYPGGATEYNAVDYDGIGGKCPEWLKFKIIKESRYAK